MAPKLLNRLQVLEIYERHRHGHEEFRDLAKEYKVTVEHVRAIVRGTIHADITRHEMPHDPTCRRCPGPDARERNLDLAYAALLQVLCWRCHASVEVLVTRVIRRNGAVLCPDCDGRSPQ